MMANEEPGGHGERSVAAGASERQLEQAKEADLTEMKASRDKASDREVDAKFAETVASLKLLLLGSLIVENDPNRP